MNTFKEPTYDQLLAQNNILQALLNDARSELRQPKKVRLFNVIDGINYQIEVGAIVDHGNIIEIYLRDEKIPKSAKEPSYDELLAEVNNLRYLQRKDSDNLFKMAGEVRALQLKLDVAIADKYVLQSKFDEANVHLLEVIQERNDLKNLSDHNRSIIDGMAKQEPAAYQCLEDPDTWIPVREIGGEPVRPLYARPLPPHQLQERCDELLVGLKNLYCMVGENFHVDDHNMKPYSDAYELISRSEAI